MKKLSARVTPLTYDLLRIATFFWAFALTALVCAALGYPDAFLGGYLTFLPAVAATVGAAIAHHRSKEQA